MALCGSVCCRVRRGRDARFGTIGDRDLARRRKWAFCNLSELMNLADKDLSIR